MPVLALLYPPGLMGGYRNQVLRLLSLVIKAKNWGIPQLLLPSILWATQLSESKDFNRYYPVPMDLLMDVEHWNSFFPHLPRLVPYQPNIEKYDCWHVEDSFQDANATLMAQQVVQRGFLTPIYNTSKAMALGQVTTTQRTLRQLNLLPNVTRCKHPRAFGGGTHAGRLWQDYIALKGKIPYNATALVLQALRPKQEWRNVATQCVESHQASNYIALHARIELEMMNHRCGVTMEKNFTKILDMVHNLTRTEPRYHKVQGVFVAVARNGMEHQEHNPGYKKYQNFLKENLQSMNRVVSEGLGTLSVFECGKHAVQKFYYDKQPKNGLEYGSILHSMINFHVATEATAFVGVRRSSYSTDIWMTRYYQGKGDTNYEYTPEGIIPLDNGGLPPTHKNC